MARGAEVPSVSELLDRYAANQDKLSSFIAKTEETSSRKLANRNRPPFTRIVTEARVDGDRTHMFYHAWHDLPTKDAPTPIAEALHSTSLWDGDRAVNWAYRGSEPGVGTIKREENYAKHSISNFYGGVPFMGVRFSEYERIDTVLRRAKTISVREELEQVGSEDCYVIDAKTSSGTYTVWIDPQHGYQIAQAEIRVGPNDNYRGTILGDGASQVVSTRNVRFENIDGIWISMEADIHRISIKPHLDWSSTSDKHFKITQITLNPDHEALGSFVPVIANGAEMLDRDFGIKYTWQDGELIPDVDEYAIDAIREMAQELKDGGQVPPGLMTTERTEPAPNDLTPDANGPPEVQTDGNESGQDIHAQSRPLPLVVLIVISLSIIVAVGLIVLRRLTISEK
jgi:hypothetical protein